MGRICGFDAAAAYRARCRALRERRIALWDVLDACERRGSLDARIVRGSEVPNDFGSFVERHRDLRAILFNGQKAATLFSDLVIPREFWDDAPVALVVLPSTSPANAASRLDDVARRWGEVVEAPVG